MNGIAYRAEITRRAALKIETAGIKDQLLKMFGIDKIKKMITVLVKGMIEESKGQNLGAQASFRRKAGAADLVKRTLGNKAWILKTLGNAGIVAGAGAWLAFAAFVINTEAHMSQQIVDALSDISGASGETSAVAIIVGLVGSGIIGVFGGEALINKGVKVQGEEDEMKDKMKGKMKERYYQERYYQEHPEKRLKAPPTAEELKELETNFLAAGQAMRS